MVNTPHSDPMRLAIDEARKAGARGEVPVGAVLVDRVGTVLAADGNRTIEYCDPAGHAEILVLRAAGKRLNNYRLSGTVLYVTLEPCAMCAAAMVHARIARLVFGAEDPKAGGVVSRYSIGADGLLNHSFVVEGGHDAEECAALLKDFFKERRQPLKHIPG
jgi:tRNA(adenine34) deaminase